ncbi:F-box protein: endocytic membrane traffic, recycling ReCYcling 1, partial [Serendipita sp. 398]
MDKWRTLEPVKLHATALPSSNKPGSRTSSRSTIANAYQNRAQYIGRLPSDIHLRIFQFLSIPDIPAYARSSRALSTLSADDRVWKDRWSVIIGEGPTAANRTKAEERMRNVLDELERRASARRTTAIAYGHAKTSSGSVDLTSVGRTTGDPQFSNGIRAFLSGAQPTIEDDFGDFATADLASDEFDDFIGATPIAASMNDTISRLSTSFSPPSLPPQGIQHGFTPFILVSATRGQYAKAHALLKPLLRYIHPSTPPHTLLPTLLPTPPPPPQPVPNFRPLSPPSLQVQAQLLSLLTRFLSPTFQPTRDWEIRSHALKSCIDVFEATVLKLFEDGDSRHDEKAMREAAWAAWEVHTAWVVP